jgi:DNA gyrase subunit B
MMVAEEYERGWSGRPTQDGGIRLSRSCAASRKAARWTARAALCRGARLGAMTEALREIYGP